MQRISKTSCYYYYGKQWKSWNRLRADFSWEIPDQMKTAFYAWIAPLFDLAFPALFYGKPVLTYLSGGKFDPEKAP